MVKAKYMVPWYKHSYTHTHTHIAFPTITGASLPDMLDCPPKSAHQIRGTSSKPPTLTAHLTSSLLNESHHCIGQPQSPSQIQQLPVSPLRNTCPQMSIKYMYGDTDMYAHTHTCMQTCMHTHTHMYADMYAHMQTCMYVCTHVHMSKESAITNMLREVCYEYCWCPLHLSL